MVTMLMRWWLALHGTPRREKPECITAMNARQCVKYLKQHQDSRERGFYQVVERLEWLTEHPDINGYLSRTEWWTMRTKRILAEIMSEVVLIQELATPHSNRIK